MTEIIRRLMRRRSLRTAIPAMSRSRSKRHRQKFSRLSESRNDFREFRSSDSSNEDDQKLSKGVSKMKCRLLTLATLSVTLLAGLSNVSWAAEDGAALFKKKCAGCHGQQGEGKPAM